MASLELCKKQPASLSLSGTKAKPRAVLPRRALQTHWFMLPFTSSGQIPWVPVISKSLIHFCFILTCHSPDYLMVQRSRSVIFIFPAWRKLEFCHLSSLLERSNLTCLKLSNKVTHCPANTFTLRCYSWYYKIWGQCSGLPHKWDIPEGI